MDPKFYLSFKQETITKETRVYTCAECSQEFSDSYQVMRHYAVQHSHNGEKRINGFRAFNFDDEKQFDYYCNNSPNLPNGEFNRPGWYILTLLDEETWGLTYYQDYFNQLKQDLENIEKDIAEFKKEFPDAT